MLPAMPAAGPFFVTPTALAAWRRLAASPGDDAAVRAHLLAVLEARIAAYADEGRQPEQSDNGCVVYRLARSSLPSRARLRIVVSYARAAQGELPQIVDVKPETGRA